MNAWTSKKERFIGWLMVSLFGLLYMYINTISHRSAPHPSVDMSWEMKMPFVPEFIFFYDSMYLIVILLFVLAQRRFELWTLVLRIVFIGSVSYAFFIMLPLEFAFSRPKVESFWLVNQLFELLEASDMPYNQLPSLHISSFVVYWFSLRKYLGSKWLKSLVFMWFLLVGVSVLVIYQHHFWDVLTGFLLGLLAVILISEEKIKKMKL